jgi:peptidoglycan/LPS O-acetylase OafA/YrhL
MPDRPQSEPKYEFIDAARGYAILLVVICHTALKQEPWPLRRFTELGWHGVQLFFVVSSMTLALSWHHRRRVEVYPFLSFLVRRVFRIWPMYFVAFILYLVIWPPGSMFSVNHMLATLTFVHGWSPGLLPTTEGWDPVPGSWSVAAEFGFYLLFPLLIWIAATPARAILLVVLSLIVAYASNTFAYSYYVGTYGHTATDQWMYYSLPNQLPVFALGFVAYHAFVRLQPGHAWAFMRPRLLKLCPLVIVVAVALFLSLGLLQLPRVPTIWPLMLPVHLLAGIAFVLGVLAMGLWPTPVLVNRLTIWLGKVSYSVYLIHFAVNDAVRTLAPGVFGPSVMGMRAILGAAMLLLVTLSVSFALSLATFHLIEQPMIARGRLVCDWLNRSVVRRPAPQPSAGLR